MAIGVLTRGHWWLVATTGKKSAAWEVARCPPEWALASRLRLTHATCPVVAAVLGEAGANSPLPPLPVFRPACWATYWLLARLSLVPRLVRLLGVQQARPQPRAALSDSSLGSMATVDTR